jgi:hypothetical protein
VKFTTHANGTRVQRACPRPPARQQVGKALIFALLTFATLIGALLKCSEVNDALAPEDIPALRQILGASVTWPVSPDLNDSWEAQRASIQRTVKLVSVAAPNRRHIPEGQTREPADVIRNGGGVCYDRSRLLEKALQAQGLKIRHVALYRHVQGMNGLQLLFTKRTISHAVSEVLTLRGWIVIDPIDGWIALDAHLNPLSIVQLAERAANHEKSDWSGHSSHFFDEPFMWIYGLYSRHGMFYPPFNAIPDVNYRQLMDNLR